MIATSVTRLHLIQWAVSISMIFIQLGCFVICYIYIYIFFLLKVLDIEDSYKDLISIVLSV